MAYPLNCSVTPFEWLLGCREDRVGGAEKG
jgi:hypothetical protein